MSASPLRESMIVPVPKERPCGIFDANANRRGDQARRKVAVDGRLRRKLCWSARLLDRDWALCTSGGLSPGILLRRPLVRSCGAGPTDVFGAAGAACAAARGSGDCAAHSAHPHHFVLGLLKHLLQALAAGGADLAIDFAAVDEHHEARNAASTLNCCESCESRVVSTSRIG